MSIGVTFIGLTGGKFSTDNGDYRGEDIGEIIDGVQDNRNRTGNEADQHLKTNQNNIGDNTNNTSPDDGGLSIHYDIIACFVDGFDERCVSVDRMSNLCYNGGMGWIYLIAFYKVVGF